MKIVIWGYPLNSHTHSYIHSSFYKAFKHLGHDVYWFHDDEYPEDFDWNDCVFWTEGFADKNIPLNKTSTYFVHVCPDPAKYINAGVKKFIDVRPNGVWQKDHVYDFTLDKSKALHISPIEATKILRKKHAYIEEITLPANKEVVLESIKGNTIELFAEIDPKLSRWVQLNVLRSPNAEEKTSITFYNYDRKLTYWYDTKGEVVLDGSHSSILEDVWLRPPERAIMERKQETLKLRVFIDRSVIEVFVNGRQYLAMRVYPGLKESIGVSLLAQGSEANLIRLDAWEMKGIF